MKIQLKIYDDDGKKVFHEEVMTSARLGALKQAAWQWLLMWGLSDTAKSPD